VIDTLLYQLSFLEDRPSSGDAGSDEWHTPAPWLRAAEAAFGEAIDLDPCSCAAAQGNVRAARYFTRADDGLRQPWVARTCWLNPPYSNPLPWVQRALAAYDAGAVGQLLVLTNASFDPEWAQLLAARCCVLVSRERIQFLNLPGKSNRYGQAIWYCGPHDARFAAAYAQLAYALRAPSTTYGQREGRAHAATDAVHGSGV
jgi:ParB family chromosome partitioning protein